MSAPSENSSPFAEVNSLAPLTEFLKRMEQEATRVLCSEGSNLLHEEHHPMKAQDLAIYRQIWTMQYEQAQANRRDWNRLWKQMLSKDALAKQAILNPRGGQDEKA